MQRTSHCGPLESRMRNAKITDHATLLLAAVIDRARDALFKSAAKLAAKDTPGGRPCTKGTPGTGQTEANQFTGRSPQSLIKPLSPRLAKGVADRRAGSGAPGRISIRNAY
jgi:hypothetical protein